MANHSSMLHVRVDDNLKVSASKKLSGFGLTVSDAVRILLTRVVEEGGLPVSLTVDSNAYDTWFKEKVQQALTDTVSEKSHDEIMDQAKSLIESKSRKHA